MISLVIFVRILSFIIILDHVAMPHKTTIHRKSKNKIIKRFTSFLTKEVNTIDRIMATLKKLSPEKAQVRGIVEAKNNNNDEAEITRLNLPFLNQSLNSNVNTVFNADNEFFDNHQTSPSINETFFTDDKKVDENLDTNNVFSLQQQLDDSDGDISEKSDDGNDTSNPAPSLDYQTNSEESENLINTGSVMNNGTTQHSLENENYGTKNQINTESDQLNVDTDKGNLFDMSNKLKQINSTNTVLENKSIEEDTNGNTLKVTYDKSKDLLSTARNSSIPYTETQFQDNHKKFQGNYKKVQETRQTEKSKPISKTFRQPSKHILLDVKKMHEILARLENPRPHALVDESDEIIPIIRSVTKPTNHPQRVVKDDESDLGIIMPKTDTKPINSQVNGSKVIGELLNPSKGSFDKVSTVGSNHDMTNWYQLYPEKTLKNTSSHSNIESISENTASPQMNLPHFVNESIDLQKTDGDGQVLKSKQLNKTDLEKAVEITVPAKDLGITALSKPILTDKSINHIHENHNDDDDDDDKDDTNDDDEDDVGGNNRDSNKLFLANNTLPLSNYTEMAERDKNFSNVINSFDTQNNTSVHQFQSIDTTTGRYGDNVNDDDKDDANNDDDDYAGDNNRDRNKLFLANNTLPLSNYTEMAERDKNFSNVINSFDTQNNTSVHQFQSIDTTTGRYGDNVNDDDKDDANDDDDDDVGGNNDKAGSTTDYFKNPQSGINAHSSFNGSSKTDDVDDGNQDDGPNIIGQNESTSNMLHKKNYSSIADTNNEEQTNGTVAITTPSTYQEKPKIKTAKLDYVMNISNLTAPNSKQSNNRHNSSSHNHKSPKMLLKQQALLLYKKLNKLADYELNDSNDDVNGDDDEAGSDDGAGNDNYDGDLEKTRNSSNKNRVRCNLKRGQY